MDQIGNLSERPPSSQKRKSNEDEDNEKGNMKRAKKDCEGNNNASDSSSSSEGDDDYKVVVEKKKKFTVVQQTMIVKASSPYDIVFRRSTNSSDAFSYSSESTNRREFNVKVNKGKNGRTLSTAESAKKFAEVYQNMKGFCGSKRESSSSNEDENEIIDVGGNSPDCSSTSEYKSTNSVICVSDDEVSSSASPINSRNGSESSPHKLETAGDTDVENSESENNTSQDSNDVRDDTEAVVSSTTGNNLGDSVSDPEDINSEDAKKEDSSQADSVSHKSEDFVDGAPVSEDTKNISESVESGEKCPICMTPFSLDQIVASPQYCSHYYCVSCICQWAKKNKVCPVDRIEFETIFVKKYGCGEVIEDLHPFSSECD